MEIYCTVFKTNTCYIFLKTFTMVLILSCLQHCETWKNNQGQVILVHVCKEM